MRFTTQLTLTTGFALALLGAAATRSEAASLLDGKTFNGKAMEKASRKEESDVLVFREGKLRSLNCDPYGFNEAPYMAKKNGSRIEFEAVTSNPQGGKITWKGSVDGDQIQGTSVLMAGKQIAAEYSFTGRAEKIDASAATLESAAMKRVAPMMGSWKLASLSGGDGKQIAGASGTVTCEDAGNGLGLLCRLAVRGIPGLDEYRLAGVLGYDAGGSRYHFYSVSNVGETHDHAGAFSDEKTLALEYKGEVDGKPFVEKLDFIFDGGKLVGKGKSTLGGVVVDDSTFVFEKRS